MDAQKPSFLRAGVVDDDERSTDPRPSVVRIDGQEVNFGRSLERPSDEPDADRSFVGEGDEGVEALVAGVLDVLRYRFVDAESVR